MASAKVNHVKSARKAIGDQVKVGQEYWWWKFRHGAKIVSATNPNMARMIRLTEHEERTIEFNSWDNITNKEELEQLKEEAEEYRDDLQDRLDNLPESLKESHVLTERIEEMETLISDMESGIDTIDDSDNNEEEEAED